MQLPKAYASFRSRYMVLTRDLLLPLAVMGIAAAAWCLAWFSPLLSVQEIDCLLDFEPCTNQNVLAELDKSRGQNLLRLDTKALSSRFRSADFTIRSVEITRRLPHTLAVRLQSVYPSVSARVEGSEVWLIFDPDLRLIGTRTSDPNVPTLNLHSLPRAIVGQRLPDDSINTALGLALRISSTIPSVQNITLEGDLITAQVGEHRTAIMTTSADLAPQLSSLRALLANATILEGVQTVDVRFAQPVLK